MIDATQIRKGMLIIMNGTLYRVMEMQLITPGRWKAMVQTKLRNVREGSQVEHRFRSEERLEQARLEEISRASISS
jgi:elongation factor P